jgi:protein ImuB
MHPRSYRPLAATKSAAAPDTQGLPKGLTEGPLVTRAHNGRRQVVAAANAAAQALGISPGMPLAEAEARLPGLAVHEAAPLADQAALEALGAWCLRYTPLLAAPAEAGLLLDVTGCTHLWGGEAGLLADLLGELQAAGYAARAALASTPGAAWALARFGQNPTIVPEGEEPTALAALPMAALRLPPEMVQGLALLGLERIGQLAEMPRASLTRRFGTAPHRALDAALQGEPITPWLPEAVLRQRTSFLEPLLTAEALAIAIQRLVAALCDELARIDRGARILDMHFERVDGSVQSLRVGTAKPSRAPLHLARMLCEKLDTVAPGFGIEAMRLVVPLAEPLRPQQSSAAFGEAPPGDIAALVDRLSNRLGEGRVFRMAPTPSDVPERSARRVPPLTAPPSNWPLDWPRPVRVFTPPFPVEAIAALPDGPPAAFTWQRQRRRIRRADGPERIAGEWWRHEAETTALRDYWQVEDEAGRRYWLFRRGDGQDEATGDLRWFLHGLF